MSSIEWWHVQWPWRTPNPDFKVTAFLKSNIWKTVCFRNKVTREHIGNHKWQVDSCRFRWPWVTLKGRMWGINFFQADLNNAGWVIVFAQMRRAVCQRQLSFLFLMSQYSRRRRRLSLSSIVSPPLNYLPVCFVRDASSSIQYL